MKQCIVKEVQWAYWRTDKKRTTEAMEEAINSVPANYVLDRIETVQLSQGAGMNPDVRSLLFFIGL
jgi:hypothetical protein